MNILKTWTYLPHGCVPELSATEVYEKMALSRFDSEAVKTSSQRWAKKIQSWGVERMHTTSLAVYLQQHICSSQMS